MAKKYLAVPATSTPSERAFSVAGCVVNKKCACLLPENVNMLIFCMKIYHKCRYVATFCNNLYCTICMYATTMILL